MKQLNWGMIGGGKGSQIGPAHRLAAGLDAHFKFVAGALDHDPAAGRAYAPPACPCPSPGSKL